MYDTLSTLSTVPSLSISPLYVSAMDVVKYTKSPKEKSRSPSPSMSAF